MAIAFLPYIDGMPPRLCVDSHTRIGAMPCRMKSIGALEIFNSLGLTDTWADGAGPVIQVGHSSLVRIPFYTVRPEVRQLAACLTLPMPAFQAWLRMAAAQRFDNITKEIKQPLPLPLSWN